MVEKFASREALKIKKRKLKVNFVIGGLTDFLTQKIKILPMFAE
jgi:hypothetical protein